MRSSRGERSQVQNSERRRVRAVVGSCLTHRGRRSVVSGSLPDFRIPKRKKNSVSLSSTFTEPNAEREGVKVRFPSEGKTEQSPFIHVLHFHPTTPPPVLTADREQLDGVKRNRLAN